MDGICEKCGDSLQWKGSIRDGKMECPTCDHRYTINIDMAAGGVSYSAYTWVVPDDLYNTVTVQEMLARGCRVIRASDMYKQRDPVFQGAVGTWDGVTIITDEFHGD